MSSTRPFWAHLLDHRSEATWGNFAWFSPRTLLQSINDQIAHEIEEPGDAGSIVDRRRMRWVAEQQARGVFTFRPLRIPGSRGFLALGDPGEMDASQYVLVRDLSAATAQLDEDDAINTALLLSDVVYPAGDINQWVDAVYLPYLGLPREAWSKAMSAWQAEDEAARVAFDPPLKDWHVLAMPGNHDWYDGLNGFMYHACRSEPLPEISYDTAGLTIRQRIAVRWWRSPAAPKREKIAPIRDRDSHRHLVGIPNLPGPYYAVDFGCHRHRDGNHPGPPDYRDCEPAWRLVCVDNGITGSIDVEQADWLDRILAGHQAVVVATGKPIVVNNTVNRMRVADDPSRDPERDVLSIVQSHPNVVATIAGDIHNYQRVRLEGPAGTPTVPLQVVSGGAGAFLSAAHSVRFTKSGGLPIDTSSTAGTTAGLEPEVDREDHHRFPSRTQSVLHFAPRLLRGYGAVLLALSTAGLVGLGVAAWAATDTVPLLVEGQPLSAGRVLLASWLTVIWLGTAAAGAWWLRRLPRAGERPAKVSAVVLLGPVLLVAVLARTGGVVGLVSALVGAGVILSMVLIQVAPPLLQSFPRLRHGLVARVILVAALAFLVWREGADTWKWLVIGAVVVVVVRIAIIAARERMSKRPARPVGTVGAAVRGAAPFVLTGALLGLVTMLFPEAIARAFSVEQDQAVGGLVRALASSTLAVTSAAGLVAGAVIPVRAARRYAPSVVIVALVLVSLVGAAGGVAATIAVVGDLNLPTWGLVVSGVACGAVLVVLGAVLGLAVAVGAQSVLSTTPPTAEVVQRALAQRDAAGRPAAASRSLFLTMAVASVPGLESMAEASVRDFGKNVLVVDLPPPQPGLPPDQPRHLRFRAFGLDNESSGMSQALRAARPDQQSSDSPGAGFFLVDEVLVDLASHEVEVVHSWPAPEPEVDQDAGRA